MAKTKKVEVVCTSCGGTGLYRGMCEGPGEAVVCVYCNGTGRKTIEYTPFEFRKARKDVKQVHRSLGALLPTGCGPVGDSISYDNWWTMTGGRTPTGMR